MAIISMEMETISFTNGPPWPDLISPEFFGSNLPLGSRWVRAAGGSIEERQNESDTLEVSPGGSGGMIRFFPKILGEAWYVNWLVGSISEDLCKVSS